MPKISKKLIITKTNDKKLKPSDPIAYRREFLNHLKYLTIMAYVGSEEIGENVLMYDPVPTAYYCGDLQEISGGKSSSL